MAMMHGSAADSSAKQDALKGGGSALDPRLRQLIFSADPVATGARRGIAGYATLLHMWLFFRYFVGSPC